MEKVIKNMVCPRCVDSVSSIAEQLRLPVEQIEIGRAQFSRKLTDEEIRQLEERLYDKGFELVSTRNEEIASRVKTELIEYLDHLEKSRNPVKVSRFLSDRLPFNYSYLSHLFSGVKGETIEHYLIKLKIERVKELLSYDQFTLSEIAWKLKYSSVQYLSNQFKSVTGKTVTEYLSDDDSERISLDQL